MAGFILTCSRRGAEAPSRAEDLRRLALHLAPDNITPNPPHVVEDGGLAWAVVNPVPGVRIRANGVCLGALFEDADWSVPLGGAPNGSFALLRHDDHHVELITDLFASRAIWYVHEGDLFAASTSQRALVALLGDFEPRPEAVSWMIASGYLGPDCGWDRRLRRVPFGTSLCLDRDTWESVSEAERIRYQAADLAEAEHLARLRDGIFAVCRDVDLSSTPSVLTLSGGYDSRALLLGLAHAGKPPDCITWGLASSLDDPANDAAVARRLAERFGRSFRYLLTDLTDEPVHDVLTRWLKASEGRAEDFGGYTDGLELWRTLFDSGLGALIRGDAPGWGDYPLVNAFVARSMNERVTLIADYPEGHLIQRLDLVPQHMPPDLYQQDGETLVTYNDRLTNEYTVPVCLGALLDAKCAYIEVIDPLLGRQVVDVVAHLPDALRRERVGYRRMVTELAPDVPFATSAADAVSDQYLQWPRLQAELLAELSSREALDVLSDAALGELVGGLERPAGAASAKTRLRGHVKAVVPERVIRRLRPTPRWHLAAPNVAFRAYIASRMAAILREDAEALASR